MTTVTGSRSPESARRRRTRERLLDAAYALFAEHGIHATPIEAIAEAAGFTRGAFYSNFESKTELFFALAEREWRVRLEQLQAAFERTVPDAPPGRLLDEDVVRRVADEVFDALPDDRRWALIHSEFELFAMRDRDVAARFLAREQAIQRELAAVLDATVRSAGLRFVIEPVDLTRLITEQYNAAMRQAILAGEADQAGAARRSVMRSLPAVLRRLTEPLTGGSAEDGGTPAR